MRLRAAAAVAAGVAAVAGGALWLILRGGGGEPLAASNKGFTAGTALGRMGGMAAAMVPSWRRPVRCLDLTAVGPPGELRAGKRTFRAEGGRLAGGEAGGTVRLGVVVDARGATAATLAAVARVRAHLAQRGVAAVLVLGGIGGSQEEIEAVLEALASPDTLLVAMPGDREPVAAHEESVAALAARGLPVVDGARTPLLVVDGVAIGLLPGVAAGADGRAHGQVAGADGCARVDEDADALAARLAALPAPRVLASHAPPRQRARGGTDQAQGGVHMGDLAVARAARAAGVVAVVHGLIDETGGQSARDGDTVIVSAGVLEAGGAVILEITGNQVTVRRIPE